jgi:two-component system nitrate/nitrite response regulator NarL
MPERRVIRLLLVDDHALVREGIRSSLLHYPAIVIVGEAGNGREAITKCRELKPDVVLIDLNMPEMGGLEAIPLLLKTCPAARIIVLTVHDAKEYVTQVLHSGAHGYVLKDTSPEELVRAVQSVADGQAFFSPSVSRVLLADYVGGAQTSSAGGKPTASAREKQVLQLIAQGKTSKEIAGQFKLSTRTVETYRVRLKRKLNARNVAELLSRAREQRWL